MNRFLKSLLLRGHFPMFDIVIPVYNSLNHVRPCLNSLSRNIPDNSKIIIVDDGSDEYVSKEIKKICDRFKVNVEYVKNNENMGYLKSCNKGISSGNNPFVILTNSDTIVFRNTFEILKKTFEDYPNIGVINPVSTWANWTRIPFPNGFNILQLNSFVQDVDTPELVVDLNNASGFFLGIRRNLFEEIGLFDEVFNPGYYEETDFCMKVLEKGYKVSVHKGLYVFHHGWGSFGEQSRNHQMSLNKDKFMKRWEDKYNKLEKKWLENDPIKDLKESLGDNVPNQNSLEVVYVLPNLDLNGRSISAIQIVNQLNLLGCSANLAIWGKIDEDFLRKYPLYFRPYIFDSEVDLVENFPKCAFAVVTDGKIALKLLETHANDGMNVVYQFQEYYPFNYGNNKTYSEPSEAYNLSHKIVKSSWLNNKLRYFGGSVHKIPTGIDTDVFYERKLKREIQIVSYLKTDVELRNLSILKEIFRKLKEEYNSINLAVLGNVPGDFDDFEFPVNLLGILKDPKEVANVLNSSIIALDVSTSHLSGRFGLEAMACGTATVLTRNGGITEYAKHRFNTLLVNPTNIDEIVQNVKNLLENIDLRARLIKNGYETSKKYSLRNETKMTKQFFEELG